MHINLLGKLFFGACAAAIVANVLAPKQSAVIDPAKHLADLADAGDFHGFCRAVDAFGGGSLELKLEMWKRFIQLPAKRR